MKTATKIISLSGIFVISGLIGFFNLFFASKVATFLKNLKSIAKAEGSNFFYSKMYIICYILTSVLILICLLSLLFNNYSHTPTKKILQTMFLYVNIGILVIIVVCLLIVILKNYDLLNSLTSAATPVEESGIEYSYYVNLFLLLTFNGVSNIVLSALSLKYCNEESVNEVNKNEVEQNDGKSLLRKEIEQMKEQLEIENLKSEYYALYSQMQKNKDKK